MATTIITYTTALAPTSNTVPVLPLWTATMTDTLTAGFIAFAFIVATTTLITDALTTPAGTAGTTRCIIWLIYNITLSITGFTFTGIAFPAW